MAVKIQDQVLVHFVQGSSTWMARQERVFVGMLKGYGGKREGKQSLLDCLVDEIQKETGVLREYCRYHETEPGIKVLPEHLHLKGLAYITEVDDTNEVGKIIRLWCYHSSIYKGVPVATVEMDDPQLYPINNLPFTQMVPGDDLLIPLIFLETFFKASFTRRSFDKGMLRETFEFNLLEKNDLYVLAADADKEVLEIPAQ